jgi:hypothetical protein
VLGKRFVEVQEEVTDEHVRGLIGRVDGRVTRRFTDGYGAVGGLRSVLEVGSLIGDELQKNVSFFWIRAATGGDSEGEVDA